MRNLVSTPSFEKKLGRFLSDHSELERKVEQTLNLLSRDIFDTKLKTHKLSGAMKLFYASSVDYKYRIVFSFNSASVFLFNIGTHDEVY